MLTKVEQYQYTKGICMSISTEYRLFGILVYRNSSINNHSDWK